jgi:putative transposase
MPQSLSNLLIHIIFSTKERKLFIDKEIKSDLYAYISGIAKIHDSHIHEIGGVEDHIHILLVLPRTVPLSKLIEEIKKSSSKWCKTRGIRYKEFAWQKGYAAFSIGQSNIEALRQYIQNQEKHHEKISSKDEYRNFLIKYNVLYDERYMWD